MNGPNDSGNKRAGKAIVKQPMAKQAMPKPLDGTVTQPSYDKPSAIEVAAPEAPSVAEMIEAAVASEPVLAEPPVGDPVPALETETVPAEPATAPAEAISAEAEPAIPPAAEPVAAFQPLTATKKGFFNMATTFDAVSAPAATTEKVQAMFGGLNDRAKTAMEKSAKFSEELTELTKGNVEAIVASGKVVAKGAETMTQEAADFGKKSFESTTAMFKSLAGIKSPTELFQIQSDFAKSSFDSAVAEASKLSEAWVKLAGEMVQPISNRYAVAAEKLKAAAL